MIAALAFAPSVEAKGRVALEICGSSGCTIVRDTEDRRLVLAIVNWPVLELAAAPPLAPYHEVELRAPGTEADPHFFVASRGLLSSGSTWVRLDARTASSLRAVVRALRPWPSPRLTEVRVAGRPVPSPGAYEALFRHLPGAEPPPLTAKRIGVAVETGRTTPWTSVIDYVPARRLLHRDGGWFRPPTGLIQLIERDARLSSPEAAPTTFPWASLSALAAAAGLLAVASAYAVRRSRRGSHARAA